LIQIRTSGKNHRHERIDVLQGIQCQPPEHVGGLIALSVRRLGMGVFVRHDREQEHRGEHEDLLELHGLR